MEPNKIKKADHLEVFQIDSIPYGQSYVKWTEKWWQWVFSIPKEENPIIDMTGEKCSKGQEGPVWYLAGTTRNRSNAKRICIIPRAKSILFPVIVSQFSHSERPALTKRELVKYTSKDIEQTNFLEVIIDDIHLSHLSKFRIQSSFTLDIIEDNIWDLKPGPTWAASDGFWVFLKPLNKGKHSIGFHGVEPNFETKVKYDLTII
jgi:hypothetical protein